MMDDVNENPPISGDSPSALPDSHNKMNLDQEQTPNDYSIDSAYDESLLTSTPNSSRRQNLESRVEGYGNSLSASPSLIRNHGGLIRNEVSFDSAIGDSLTSASASGLPPNLIRNEVSFDSAIGNSLTSVSATGLPPNLFGPHNDEEPTGPEEKDSEQSPDIQQPKAWEGTSTTYTATQGAPLCPAESEIAETDRSEEVIEVEHEAPVQGGCQISSNINYQPEQVSSEESSAVADPQSQQQPCVRPRTGPRPARRTEKNEHPDNIRSTGQAQDDAQDYDDVNRTYFEVELNVVVDTDERKNDNTPQNTPDPIKCDEEMSKVHNNVDTSIDRVIKSLRTNKAMQERLKMVIDFRNQQMFLPNSLTETNNQLQTEQDICNSTNNTDANAQKEHPVVTGTDPSPLETTAAEPFDEGLLDNTSRGLNSMEAGNQLNEDDTFDDEALSANEQRTNATSAEEVEGADSNKVSSTEYQDTLASQEGTPDETSSWLRRPQARAVSDSSDVRSEQRIGDVNYWLLLERTKSAEPDIHVKTDSERKERTTAEDHSFGQVQSSDDVMIGGPLAGGLDHNMPAIRAEGGLQSIEVKAEKPAPLPSLQSQLRQDEDAEIHDTIVQMHGSIVDGAAFTTTDKQDGEATGESSVRPKRNRRRKRHCPKKDMTSYSQEVDFLVAVILLVSYLLMTISVAAMMDTDRYYVPIGPDQSSLPRTIRQSCYEDNPNPNPSGFREKGLEEMRTDMQDGSTVTQEQSYSRLQEMQREPQVPADRTPSHAVPNVADQVVSSPQVPECNYDQRKLRRDDPTQMTCDIGTSDSEEEENVVLLTDVDRSQMCRQRGPVPVRSRQQELRQAAVSPSIHPQETPVRREVHVPAAWCQLSRLIFFRTENPEWLYISTVPDSENWIEENSVNAMRARQADDQRNHLNLSGDGQYASGGTANFQELPDDHAFLPNTEADLRDDEDHADEEDGAVDRPSLTYVAPYLRKDDSKKKRQP